MSSKTALMVIGVLVAFCVSVALGYLVAGGFMFQSGDEEGGVELQQAVSDEYRQRIEVDGQDTQLIFEEGYQISPGQGYSEVVVSDLIVDTVESRDDVVYLRLLKGDQTLEVPVLGEIGILFEDGNETEFVMAANLSDQISANDAIRSLRLMYVDSGVTLDQGELEAHFRQKISGQEADEEVFRAYEVLGVERLTQDDIASRFGQDFVTFSPEEVLVSFLNVELYE